MINAVVFFSTLFVGALAVDTVVLNGHVVTLDRERPEAEAFAIDNGFIVDIGTTAEIQSRYPEARRLNMFGRTILPGMLDAHAHLVSLGNTFIQVNLLGVETPEEAVKLVEERIVNTSPPPGQWVIGWGWDEGEWATDYPDFDELNQISPQNPVWLRGLHGFAGWGNRLAFELANITSATPEPDNGEIIRDTDGNPTGVLTNRAQDLVTVVIPPVTVVEMEEIVLAGALECLRNGITSVHEVGIDPTELRALENLRNSGRLPIRVYGILDGTNEALLEPYLLNGPVIDPQHFLDIRGLKVFVDGALGSRGALMFSPYSDDPTTSGVLTTSYEELYDISLRAMNASIQVLVHAIGDLANNLALGALGRAIHESGAVDPRPRIEHAQVVRLIDIPAFSSLGVIASMQPLHATSDSSFAEDRVGPERVLGAYAWRSFVDGGATLMLNSDFPGESWNPFWNIYAAETRQDEFGEPAGGWYPEQRLEREEALFHYNVVSAYGGFEEDLKGQIREGLLADFIVISDDIMNISARELLTLEVQEVFINGELVFSAKTR